MEILLKFTKASFFLGGKVLVTSESDNSAGQSKDSASGGGGGCNEAKLAKAAVAAAAATLEHATIMIPALQHHRRNLSAFNWKCGQGYEKSFKGTATQSSGEAASEEKVEMEGGGFQLRRTGKALDDLKAMLEDHEVQFPSCSYEEFDDDEFEEYDSCKLETIWEEDEDEC